MAHSRFVLMVALALGAAASSLAKEYVVTLTSKNFDEEVKKHDFIVVEFYAPWCGHCKSLAPEYEKAAKTLSEEGSSVVLAKVDADASANKPLAQRFGVQGFPTIKIFRNKDVENPQDYKGPREADGIVSFVKKQAGPASQGLFSTGEIKEILDSDKVAVVGVFSDLSSPEYEVYTKVANALRADFAFRHTTDASLLPVEHDELAKVPAVRVLKAFDEGFADISEFDEEKLKAHIRAHSVPLVIEFSNDPKDRPFLSRAFESPTSKLLLFYSYNISNANDYREAFTAVAKTRPADGGFSFLIGEASQNEHALKYFGVEEKETPAIIIHEQAANNKYYKTTIEPKDIKEFVDNFLAGKEEKKLKSEPVPAKNDEPVKVVVGKTFKELVLDANKHVLIEFYAPWCGHCKKLEPIYKQVGKAFKDDSDITIAKLDYTSNDLPTNKFTVEGFPTIYFYTKKGEVIPYKGDRSKKDLIDFVKKQKEIAAAASNASQVEPEEAELAAEAAEKAGEEVPEKDEL